MTQCEVIPLRKDDQPNKCISCYSPCINDQLPYQDTLLVEFAYAVWAGLSRVIDPSEQQGYFLELWCIP